MTLKSKIIEALEKLGNKNGTAVPDSQDTSQPLLHEYAVATIMASYADARRKKAKEAMIKALAPAESDKLETAVESVRKTQQSGETKIAATPDYELIANVKNGASFLNEAALRVALMKKMNSVEVDKLFTECRDRREPSVTYVVLENGQ